MTLTLPPELEDRINDLILQGAYPNADTLLAEAVESLVRERKHLQAELAFEASGLTDAGLENLFAEGEKSGAHEETTARDWEDIEREGLELSRARGVR
jgi:Arc/MetJ-type ribon-helix-helix transcriptional regulator